MDKGFKDLVTLIFLDVCAVESWIKNRSSSTPIIYCPAKSMALTSKAAAIGKLVNIIENAQELKEELEKMQWPEN